MANSNKQRVIDRSGNEVDIDDFDTIYDGICGAQGGYCWAAKDRKWLLLRISTDEIIVKVDYEDVVFDQIPLIINGRTLAPLRAISEAFDCDVSWDGESKTVNIRK